MPLRIHCGLRAVTFQELVAEAATGVELVTHMHRQPREHLRAVQDQAIDEDVSPADEFGSEHIVQELDVLAAGRLIPALRSWLISSTPDVLIHAEEVVRIVFFLK